VPAQVRRRLLRTFVRRGLIGKYDAAEMAGWEHGSGFSVDAAVRIEGNDLAGLERRLRYCARPPFALEYLLQRDGVLAPNAPLRTAVTALAPAAVPPTPTFAANGDEPRYYLWAMLLARIYWHSRWPALSATPRCASSPSSTRPAP
jgi:hypothetical protein